MSLQTKTIESFLLPLSGLAEIVRTIVEPVLDNEGCELIDLKASGGHQNPLIQLFVEQNNGEGITLDQLEQLNRSIGDILDVEDGDRALFSGRYTLELSSPGVERPLTKKSHFSKVEGKEIKVKILDAGQKATYQGELISVKDEGFELAAADSGGADDVKFVSWQTVQKANLVFSFGSAKQKPNQKNRKKKNVGKAASRAGGNPKKSQKRRQDI